MAAAFPLSLVIFEISNPFESVKLSACKPDDEAAPMILMILICPKSESCEIFDNTTPAASTLALTPSMAMDLILNFPRSDKIPAAFFSRDLTFLFISVSVCKLER